MVVTRQKLSWTGCGTAWCRCQCCRCAGRNQRVTAGKPEFISAGHFTLPGTRTGFQLLHGTKVPSMSDWQTQMAGLVQTAPEDRTNPFNLGVRSEEHTSELQSLMRISYAVFCLKKKNNKIKTTRHNITLVTSADAINHSRNVQHTH